MATLPTLKEKSPDPPGLLPKNVQSWLLAGLALLMVLIMWLTGGKKPPGPAKLGPPSPAVAPPLEVNEAKIVELQKRIERLQREQELAQNALAGQSQGAEPGRSGPPFEPRSAGESQPGGRPEDAIRAERKKRDYLSLFASNVALSYRREAASPPGSEQAPALSRPAPDRTPAQRAEPAKPLEGPGAPPAAPFLPPTSPEQRRKEETRNPVAGPAGAPAAATSPTYVLLEGTVLEAVLVNRLDGQFAGPVKCLLTGDVHSHDRQHLLIPAGSSLLGESRKVEAFGQTRLAVWFHRLVMPDGYAANLDRFQGLNQIGDAGLRDQVNNHYLRIFGASLAIGAIGAVALGGTPGVLTASGEELMRQGFAQSTAQSSSQILSHFLNGMPTVTIREGHRVKVYLSGDLALPDYSSHTLPSDL